MKILQLEYFDAVCRHKSITKAATELLVSQPAISKSIIELENEYELKFFQRGNNKLELTEDGIFFWEKIKPILKTIKNLEGELKNLSKQEKNLNVGIPPMIGNFLLPDVFTKIYSNEFSMNLNVFEYGSIKIMQLLDENKVDLGFIVGETAILEKKLQKYNYLKLAETNLLFCVGKNHPFAEKKILNLRDLENVPLILRGEGSFQALKIQESFRTMGIEPSIILYSNQISMVKNILEKDQVGAFFIKEIIEKDENIIKINLEQDINLDLLLIWKKNSVLSSKIKNFIKMTKLQRHKKKEN